MDTQKIQEELTKHLLKALELSNHLHTAGDTRHLLAKQKIISAIGHYDTNTALSKRGLVQGQGFAGGSGKSKFGSTPPIFAWQKGEGKNGPPASVQSVEVLEAPIDLTDEYDNPEKITAEDEQTVANAEKDGTIEIEDGDLIAKILAMTPQKIEATYGKSIDVVLKQLKVEFKDSLTLRQKASLLKQSLQK